MGTRAALELSAARCPAGTRRRRARVAQLGPAEPRGGERRALGACLSRFWLEVLRDGCCSSFQPSPSTCWTHSWLPHIHLPTFEHARRSLQTCPFASARDPTYPSPSCGPRSSHPQGCFYCSRACSCSQSLLVALGPGPQSSLALTRFLTSVLPGCAAVLPGALEKLILSQSPQPFGGHR